MPRTRVLLGLLIAVAMSVTTAVAGHAQSRAITRAAPVFAAPVVYEGQGDDVIAIQKPSPGDPAIATISHRGSSNFSVWSRTATQEQIDLLVNTIGNYGGTVPIDFDVDQTAFLEISADGPWRIELKDALAARRFKKTVKGIGDDVLIYKRKRAGIATIVNSGDSNFAVWFYGDESDLLVNEIGAYSGRVAIGRGPAFVEITSNGFWSIDTE